jgi:DNA-binding MarR family transcriptional regulator
MVFPAQSLDTTTSFRIALLARLHRRVADQLMREIGLYVGQEMLLNELWVEDGLSQGDLAGRLGVAAPTLTVSLKGLEKSELIRRVPNENDRRVMNVFLTRKGKDIQKQVLNAWTELERVTMEDFTSIEKDLFNRLLDRATGNLLEDEE